jgi:hypothetical protein
MGKGERTLTNADRCDVGGCRAQAWVHAAFTRGDLLFCRRHYLDQREQINSQAVVVLDETAFINDRSESSA